MQINQYFDRLNSAVQKIYISTVDSKAQNLAEIHAFVCDLNDFSSLLEDKDERSLVQVACSQLESSALEMSYGLYRQSFSSLRRSLESSLAVLYFSLNKLEHYEWMRDLGDISWKSIIDTDNGALSTRASKALWPEILPVILTCNNRARLIYRALSQYVHGNKETWNVSGINIIKNDVLIEEYFKHFKEIEDILCISYSARYANQFDSQQIDQASGLLDRVSHISVIRERTGGPKG